MSLLQCKSEIVTGLNMTDRNKDKSGLYSITDISPHVAIFICLLQAITRPQNLVCVKEQDFIYLFIYFCCWGNYS